jgi:hypothetical protein
MPGIMASGKLMAHQKELTWPYICGITLNRYVENLPYFIEEIYNKKRLHSSLN